MSKIKINKNLKYFHKFYHSKILYEHDKPRSYKFWTETLNLNCFEISCGSSKIW